jgi:hypothetical protein
MAMSACLKKDNSTAFLSSHSPAFYKQTSLAELRKLFSRKFNESSARNKIAL